MSLLLPIVVNDHRFFRFFFWEYTRLFVKKKKEFPPNKWHRQPSLASWTITHSHSHGSKTSRMYVWCVRWNDTRQLNGASSVRKLYVIKPVTPETKSHNAEKRAPVGFYGIEGAEQNQYKIHCNTRTNRMTMPPTCHSVNVCLTVRNIFENKMKTERNMYCFQFLLLNSCYSPMDGWTERISYNGWNIQIVRVYRRWRIWQILNGIYFTHSNISEYIHMPFVRFAEWAPFDGSKCRVGSMFPGRARK